MVRILHGIAIVLLAIIAQTPPAAPKWAWNQPAISAAEAQALTYRYYLDGSTEPKVLAGVTCSEPEVSPGKYRCTAPIPAMELGEHTVKLTASNSEGETVPSNTMTLKFSLLATPEELAVFRGGAQ